MEFKDLQLQNPWWENKERIKDDTRVATALSKKPAFTPSLDFKDRIISLRGPRQVGKTSLLKLTIFKLIEQGIDPKAIFYFACDPISSKVELIDLINTYFDFSSEIKTKYIFLDEVTFVEDWELALKYFIDLGTFEGSYLCFTGSSAPELKRGEERMPGRNIKERYALPLSFRDYVGLFTDYRLPLLSFEDLADFNKIKTACYKLAPYSNNLLKLFKQYLKCGGFPRAIYELEEKKINEDTYQSYVKWITSDLAKLKRSELIFFQVISGVCKRCGTRFGLDSFAKDNERISSHSVLSTYLELLENLFLVKTLYQINLNKKRPSFKKERKVFFMDPFLYSCFRGYTQGMYKDFSEEAESAIVKGTVIAHLSLIKPTKTYSWMWFYADKNGDTDAVLKVNETLLPIEVKWQSSVRPSDFKHSKQFKQAVLLSKNALDLANKNLLIIPVPLFLALIKVAKP